jgi:hypothetical protein
MRVSTCRVFETNQDRGEKQNRVRRGEAKSRARVEDGNGEENQDDI